MHSLKNLIPDALRRGRISREMTALKAVEVFSELLLEKLPRDRCHDLSVISFKNGIINVGCKNSAAAHWLFQRQAEFLSLIARLLPEIRVEKIRIKIDSTSYEAYGGEKNGFFKSETTSYDF